MTEKYIARTLLHLSLAFTTLGATPAQFNGDECTSSDKKDDSIFIVSKDEGIAYYDRPGSDPLFLNPSPLEDKSSFFDKVWDAIEQKRRAIFEELFSR